ncbi:L-type lectin-domain containing receptor kinase IV.1-like [Aristolochia californica]|uniref:L-type lectin-domain containing receptor kinase IV.1-like n=1 Tax=Aristolochia californica TaxID=171875 RepID=UPI0035D67871
MFLKLLLSFMLMQHAASKNYEFVFEGFDSANMSLNGVAGITGDGLLKLTNRTSMAIGHAFYSQSLRFKNSSEGNVLSFSTTFVCAIVSEIPDFSGHGMAFVISPTKFIDHGTQPSQYLGLFNLTNDGLPSNRVLAVELDTTSNKEFNDIDNNHVGIDINSVKSNKSRPAAYYDNGNGGSLKSLNLSGGGLMKVWVEYNGEEKQLDVTLSPADIPRPTRPLLSSSVDLSPVFREHMYVGFSSSTGTLAVLHYVLGWSFRVNGQASELELSRLPSLPRPAAASEPSDRTTIIGVLSITVFVVFVFIVGAVALVLRRIKYAEILEDWEQEYGPHRFSFKDLFRATKGFKEKELLGSGGFGKVYRGVLPSSHVEVAVKKISHGSKQGMKEFVAEIVSLGRLRHRNLVQLLGYCRRKGELLLVYDYMFNGSLDRFLFGHKAILSWSQRFRIIKGVASGLLYLHEEWEQIVLHRDIKASNVLLDREFNGRLGDFGLARLYDHGSDPQTTFVVGTLGYIAPELTTTGKATTSTDVFAFGAFLLEVTCGRRPILLLEGSTDGERLVDWVIQCWKKGSILDARDPVLGNEYVKEELELVMKLGLLCSHHTSAARPSMRQVMQVLDGDATLPEANLAGVILSATHSETSYLSYPSNPYRAFPNSTISVEESLLSGGR